MEELLKKIPPEKRWALTAKALLNLLFLRGSKTVVPLLGKGEGVFAPIMGWEKYNEIVIRVFGEANKKLLHWAKETFNIPVEDAIGAAKLNIVFGYLQSGPEWKYDIIEKSREKVIIRWTQCPWKERYKEFEIKPEFSFCAPVHQVGMDEGLREIDPNKMFTLTKSLLRADPYCEAVIEFKDE